MQFRLFRHFIPASVVVLASSDALLITAAFYHMLARPAAGPVALFAVARLPIPLSVGLSVAAVAVMIAIGLYAHQSFVDFRLLAGKIAIAFIVVLVLVLVALSYWRNGPHNMPDAAALPLKAALIWLGCISVTRGAFLATWGRGLLKRRVIVLGSGTQAARIAGLVASGDSPHFVPLAFIGMPGEQSCVRSDSFDWTAAGPNGFADLGCRIGASEVVVASDERRGLPVRQLLRCKLAGIRVTDFLDFWERETRTVDLEALKPSWLFYSDGFRCGMIDKVAKRTFDIAISLALLVLTLPLLAVVACLVKLDSSGPVLYRQVRVGLRGRTFRILKFRSMRVDAELDGKARWAARGDPRVTRVGAVIRKLRIDELPQVFNVLRGDMSFVGPRPERPVFVDELGRAIPYYAERHWVRPGITGWAQINYPYGASIEDARRKLSFDLYYVKNQSVFLDFVILLQTARVIFWNHGAR
jgi:sugar transferase (PEP-CTERM system associated)